MFDVIGGVGVYAVRREDLHEGAKERIVDLIVDGLKKLGVGRRHFGRPDTGELEASVGSSIALIYSELVTPCWFAQSMMPVVSYQ